MSFFYLQLNPLLEISPQILLPTHRNWITRAGSTHPAGELPPRANVLKGA